MSSRGRNQRSAYAKVKAICRACRKEQTAYASEFNRASRARCSACGGQLDRLSSPQLHRKWKVGEMDSLRYPTTDSEFEIQAYVYWKLREKGFDARGEVSTCLKMRRLDIIIYVERVASLIIEVKTKQVGRQKEYGAPTERRKQLQAYEQYGVPVVSVRGMEEARLFCSDFSLPWKG